MRRMLSGKRTTLICVALVLVTAAVYRPACRYDFVSFDDPDYVRSNSTVQSGFSVESVRWAFTTGRGGNWNPLVWFSFMLDGELFGRRPAVYHTVNIALHIVNTLLVFGVLVMMTGAVWASAFVAAAFGLHPLHVEAVAWVTARKDTLSTFFWLLTMAAYVKYVRKPAWGWYAAALVLFAAGLMSKPMLVTLPFVLLLLDYWPLKRFEPGALRAKKGRRKETRAQCFQRNGGGRLLLEKAPFITLAVLSSAVTFIVQKGAGATSLNESIGVGFRAANALISYVSYIFKTVWPTGLAVLYPHPGENVSILWACVSGLALAAITGLVLLNAKRRKYLFVGWFWYLGTLVPVIGLVQVGKHAMADRFTYVPQTGLFIMLAWLAGDVLPPFRRRRELLWAASLGVLAIMALFTSLQLPHWRDSRSLYEQAIRVTDNNMIAHHNLGRWLVAEGRLGEATEHFAAAVKIDGSAEGSKRNLANALLAQRQVEEAVTHYVETVKDVSLWTGMCNNIAWTMAAQPQDPIYAPEQAVRLAERICEVSDYKEPFYLDTLAAAYAGAGRFEEALKTAERALDFARSAGRDDLVRDIGKRMKVYREGKAYTETAEVTFSDLLKRTSEDMPSSP